jgi:hypothetical protein
MSRSILNEGPEVNVYLNRDPIEATLPVLATQAQVTDPITISLKGLSGFTSQAGKVIKVNTAENALEYADDINTEYTAGNQLNLVGTQFNLDTDIQINSLGVGTYFDVGYSNPYTAIFNGNNYSTSNPYLRWHFNGTDLRFNIPNAQGSSSTFVFQTANTNTLAVLDGNATLTVNGDGIFGDASTDGKVEIRNGGASSEIGKLLFSNNTNSNTYSFEYSENTNNFSFKKNLATLWDYADSNSPAKFTVYPVFKFGNTVFQNASNQTITLPTSTGQLALISDITAANYWSLTSNTLKTAQNTYNVLLGKSTASTGNPKLDILGNSRMDGDLTMTGTLQVENYYAVNHSTPYTSIYDPTGYSTSNPFMRYHTNGTDLTFNLPSNQGSSSSFRFLAGNSAELMRMDAGNTLKIFGTTSGKIEIENNGATNSTSTLDFTNSDNDDFYRFLYNYAANSFKFIHNHLGTDEDTVWEYNDSTEEFIINKDTIIRNDENIDAKLFLECSDATGAEAKLIFGDFDTTSKYTLQYDYNIGAPAFELLDEDENTIFRFTDADDTFSFSNNIIHSSRFISLTGNSGQITNGSQFFTLPSTSGTLALQSEAGVFTTSGTTMTADPQADNSDVCTEFKVSAQGGSNGSCIFTVEADTNNTVESSRPEIRLRSDGGLTGANINFNSNNDLQISTIFSGTKISISPSNAACDINATKLSASNDFDCAQERFAVSYDGSNYTNIFNPSGTSGADSTSGSHISYHDNGTALILNVPNTSYISSNSNTITFTSAGSARARINGSSNPSMYFYKTNGTTIYGNIGYSATFPSNMGQWGGVGTPQGFGSSREVFYMGGEDDYDDEGCWSAMNGQSHGISNPGDNYTLWWYDEDDIGSTYWRISTSGVLSSSSDRRVKTNVNTYKNSDFEKYKQIRTITYNRKIPENINPERLNKQSCIDKYNQIHYGVIAQELYSLYPELEDRKERDEWIYRRDNWNNGVYEEEHKKWLEQKEKYECCDQKDCEEVCEYKTPEPQKEFNEEEPIRTVEYNRLSLLTIGVVQGLIKENESLKQELASIKDILARNNLS